MASATFVENATQYIFRWPVRYNLAVRRAQTHLNASGTKKGGMTATDNGKIFTIEPTNQQLCTPNELITELIINHFYANVISFRSINLHTANGKRGDDGKPKRKRRDFFVWSLSNAGDVLQRGLITFCSSEFFSGTSRSTGLKKKMWLFVLHNYQMHGKVAVSSIF